MATQGQAENKQQSKKAPKKEAKKRSKEPGFLGRIFAYFKAVKIELHRVTWPTKEELINYTLVVLGTLLFFGVLIYLLDSLILPAFIWLSGLRG